MRFLWRENRNNEVSTSPRPPHVPLKTPSFSALSPRSLSQAYLSLFINRSPLCAVQKEFLWTWQNTERRRSVRENPRNLTAILNFAPDNQHVRPTRGRLGGGGVSCDLIGPELLNWWNPQPRRSSRRWVPFCFVKNFVLCPAKFLK